MTEGSCPRYFKIPHLDIYANRQEKMESQFESYLHYRAQFKGITYFRKIHCKLKKPRFAKFRISRAHITPVIRLRSNHYNLNASFLQESY